MFPARENMKSLSEKYKTMSLEVQTVNKKEGRRRKQSR